MQLAHAEQGKPAGNLLVGDGVAVRWNMLCCVVIHGTVAPKDTRVIRRLVSATSKNHHLPKSAEPEVNARGAPCLSMAW